MYGRLVNWGRWSAWAGLEPRERPELTVNEIDAMEVEQALLKMKNDRREYFDMCFDRFRRSSADLVLCQKFKCSGATLKHRFNLAYEWLIGYFDRKRAA